MEHDADAGAELRASLEDYAAGGHPVSRVIPATCACGSIRFAVVFDDDVGVCARICDACGTEVGIADSDERFDDVESVIPAECRCGNGVFEVATGFALDAAGEVRWVSVGLRCPDDGLAGVYVDWKIDYLPSTHLLQQA